MTVTITIDGKKIKAQVHQSILDVAQLNGIEIPTLCYHKHLSIDGSCRLCSVEVDGMNGFQMACALQVNDGMDVRTDTPELFYARKFVLELLLKDYWDKGYDGKSERRPMSPRRRRLRGLLVFGRRFLYYRGDR